MLCVQQSDQTEFGSGAPQLRVIDYACRSLGLAAIRFAATLTRQSCDLWSGILALTDRQMHHVQPINCTMFNQSIKGASILTETSLGVPYSVLLYGGPFDIPKLVLVHR